MELSPKHISKHRGSAGSVSGEMPTAVGSNGREEGHEPGRWLSRPLLRGYKPFLLRVELIIFAGGATPDRTYTAISTCD